MDMEQSTIAALEAAWAQHQTASQRQSAQFALALQSLHFAKSNVRPGAAADALEATLVPARAAYCDKIREENAAFEDLLKQSRRDVKRQAPATSALYQQGKPAAYERMSKMLRDLDDQGLGAHFSMNQKLLIAQLEDDKLDQFLNTFDLVKKQSEIYAAINSHKK